MGSNMQKFKMQLPLKMEIRRLSNQLSCYEYKLVESYHPKFKC